jgi:hypothetical protein
MILWMIHASILIFGKLESAAVSPRFEMKNVVFLVGWIVILMFLIVCLKVSIIKIAVEVIGFFAAEKSCVFRKFELF